MNYEESQQEPLAYRHWKNIGKCGFSKGIALVPTIIIGGDDIPYIAFCDYAHGKKATVMRYVGSNWEIVGNCGFSGFPIKEVFLCVGKEGVLYAVCYTLDEKSKENGNILVFRFYDNKWLNLNIPALFIEAGNNMAVIINEDNNLMLAVISEDRHSINVFSYQQENWVKRYEICHSREVLGNISLGYSIQQELVIAYTYSETNGGHTIIVRKLIDNCWQLVGYELFAGVSVGNLFLNVNKKNEISLAYTDHGIEGITAILMKLKNNLWYPESTNHLPAILSNKVSFAFDELGTSYIAYEDEDSDSYRILRCDGSGWVNTKIDGSSIVNTSYLTLALDRNNIPYAAYVDLSQDGKSSVASFS